MKATLLGLLTLALLVALVYFLIGAGVLQPGDLQADEAPAGIAYFAGACYVVGGLLNLATFIPLSIVVMISWAMVYGEIILLTKSIWPAVLMHAVEDALLIQLFTDHHIQIIPGTDWLISPMSGLISVIFFLAIGVGLRQLRKRRMSIGR
jgi:hypothetical protein